MVVGAGLGGVSTYRFLLSAKRTVPYTMPDEFKSDYSLHQPDPCSLEVVPIISETRLGDQGLSRSNSQSEGRAGIQSSTIQAISILCLHRELGTDWGWTLAPTGPKRSRC